MPKRTSVLPSFGTLLAATGNHIRRSVVLLLSGALIFALLMELLSSVLGGYISDRETELWHSFGRDPAVISDLLDRAREGDRTAFNDLIQEQDTFLSQLQNLPAEEQAVLMNAQRIEMLKVLWPWLVLFLGLQLTIIFVSFLFFVLTLQVGSLAEIWAMLRAHALSFTGLSFLLVVCTLLWIPYIGPLLATLIWPRFIVAPILLIQKKKGIIKSLRLSYAQTGGQWWNIAWKAILINVILAVGIGLSFALLGQMLTMPAFLLGFFVAFTWQVSLMVFAIFNAKLGQNLAS